MHPMKRPNGHTVHDVHAIVEAIVGGSVDADAPLMEAGIDSLGAVELRNQLQSAMGGHSLSTTVVFDHPTARQLAALLQPMQQASAIAAAPINTTDFDMAIEETSSSLAVVVSGVSVALPSSVVHMDALCTMSLCGHDLLCVIPSLALGCGSGGAGLCRVPALRLQAACVMAAFCAMLSSFSTASSASRQQKRRQWTPSSGSCSSVGTRHCTRRA